MAAARPATHPDGVRPSLKVALVLALVALTLLDRFGLRISATYSIPPALLAMYGLAATMLLTGSARIQRGPALLYALVVAVAALSFIVNTSLPLRQYASPASLMLIVVIYAPLVLCLRPEVGTSASWNWFIRLYVGFAVVLGAIGIVQFYAQYVFTAPAWLFDYRKMIPEAIRASGIYNTTNYLVPYQIVKSNGFFLREASTFSFLLAFGLICEWSFARRKWVIAVLAFALVVTYSGSGLLALGVAMLFPLGLMTVVRIAAAGLLVAVVFVVFGDALNLRYTLDRLGEFQVHDAWSSSAYCRFIAPGKAVLESIESAPWSAYLGHGPGTMSRMNEVCETTYGKAIFEYGLLGALAFGALVLSATAQPAVPIRIRVALVFSWLLLGGNLATPEAVALIFIVTGMWPAVPRQEAPGQRAPP